MNTYIRQINGKWYAFACDEKNGQVYSIGSDSPKNAMWFAPRTDSGIQYVATCSRTRSAAYQKARRHGNYCGEG